MINFYPLVSTMTHYSIKPPPGIATIHVQLH